MSDHDLISLYGINLPVPVSELDIACLIIRARREAPNSVAISIIVEGKAVGWIGISALHLQPRLDYWIGREYWGRGIMTEAVRNVVGWAFGRYSIDSIAAEVKPWNAASARVLQKAGFSFDGEHWCLLPDPEHGAYRLQQYRLTRKAFVACCCS